VPLIVFIRCSWFPVALSGGTGTSREGQMQTKAAMNYRFVIYLDNSELGVTELS
jgi:hypothetical protein